MVDRLSYCLVLSTDDPVCYILGISWCNDYNIIYKMDSNIHNQEPPLSEVNSL